MSALMKRLVAPLSLLMLSLFQITVAQARSDEHIQHEIEARIADSQQLAGTRIEVHVEQRLVILTGEVRIYEQKLVSERIVWTTTGVFEVDNEIRVKPKIPVTDPVIDRRVMEVVINDDRFRAAGVSVQVSEGRVFLRGHFVNFSDPTALKHKVAEIEGVIDIDMQATFLARLGAVRRSTSEMRHGFLIHHATGMRAETGISYEDAVKQNHRLDTGSEPSLSHAVLTADLGPMGACYPTVLNSK